LIQVGRPTGGAERAIKARDQRNCAPGVVVPAPPARFTTMDPINQGATMPERLMGNSIHLGAYRELRRKANHEPRPQNRPAMA
jgi:hypothetical protein